MTLAIRHNRGEVVRMEGTTHNDVTKFLLNDDHDVIYTHLQVIDELQYPKMPLNKQISSHGAIKQFIKLTLSVEFKVALERALDSNDTYTQQWCKTQTK